MSKFDYDLLGGLIMKHGVEEGVGRFFSYEGEEHFAEQVYLLEQDLFEGDSLEPLIKRLMFKYLQEYNKQGEIEEVFGKLLEVAGE